MGKCIRIYTLCSSLIESIYYDKCECESDVSGRDRDGNWHYFFFFCFVINELLKNGRKHQVNSHSPVATVGRRFGLWRLGIDSNDLSLEASTCVFRRVCVWMFVAPRFIHIEKYIRKLDRVEMWSNNTKNMWTSPFYGMQNGLYTFSLLFVYSIEFQL